MTALRLVQGGAVRRHVDDIAVLDAFELHMRTAKLSAVTMKDRRELLQRLTLFLAPTPLLEASPEELERWQQTFADLSPATVDIYSRHTVALYKWAVRTERILRDPTLRMAVIQVRKGVPHPIRDVDLRQLLVCATGALRLTYILAAFAGLRRGEICRLRVEDLQLDLPAPVALIHGKGGRERVVPVLPPVAEELRSMELPRRGPVVLHKGSAYNPERLSVDSHNFMRELGIESTLHSLRHYYASKVVQLTKDVLLVRDLLGHSSVATTQIYMQSSIEGAQDRLADFSSAARSLISNK